MNKLHRALNEAKAELDGKIKADAVNFFGQATTSLGQVLDVVVPVARKHGLDVLQTRTDGVEGHYLRTMLLHIESGESLTSTSRLVPDKPGPQGIGAAETYEKRRTLMSLFNLATDGDPDFDTHTPRQTKSASPRATSSKLGVSWKDLEVFAGKQKGKRLGQLSMDQATGFRDWLVSASKKDGKALSGKAREYVDAVDAMLAEHLAEAAGAEVVPPTGDGYIPF